MKRRMLQDRPVGAEAAAGRDIAGGRVVIVTGASRGIGLATARLLAARGDHVVLAARSEADLEGQAARIRREGGDAWTWAGDLTSAQACEAMVDHASRVAGPVDVCVMSAGLGHWMPTATMSDDAWRTTMAVNVDAVFFTTRAVLRGMLERGHGHLVYLSSVLGRKGVANMAAYCASKAAVAAFAESVAAEAKPHGVKVTVIYPGTTATGLRDQQVERPRTPDVTDLALQLSADDVADAIAWATSLPPRAFVTAMTIEPLGLAGVGRARPMAPAGADIAGDRSHDPGR